MALAHAYAAVIAEKEKEGAHAEFAKKLFAFMKNRGHLSLLPQIARILERGSEDAEAPLVLLAKESDAKRYHKNIAETLAALGADAKKAQTRIDPRAVGGYAVRAGAKTIDRTFRSALISLYKEAIRS